jgi:acetyl esterase/lipase
MTLTASVTVHALVVVCGLALAVSQPPMEGGDRGQPPAARDVSGPAVPTARMQEVLDELTALKGKPIETLTPKEARKQPTIADAAKEWLKHHKDVAPKTPEEVADIDNTHYQRGEGATNPAGTAGVEKGREKLRLYKPMAAKGAPKDQLWPVVVYWHGGGFVIADIDTYDASCRALANASGCIVASAEYRKAPESPFPAAADDAVSAYRWVVAHAKEFGGDPRRVAVAGESAGGNLAAVVCLAAKEQGFQMPTHQVLIYPVVQDSLHTDSEEMYANAKPLNREMMSWFFGHYGQKADDKSPLRKDDAPVPPRVDLQEVKPLPNPDWRMLPLKAKDHMGLPPATIILAEIDPLASDGEMYARALEKAGVQVRLRKFAGVTHEFFGLTAILPEAKEAVQYAADGLKGEEARGR